MAEDDDVDRINERFVSGEITLNEFIARMEKLASLARDDTNTDPGGSR